MSLEEKLSDAGYSENEVGEAVRAKITEYAGLLSRDAALKLVARERGIETAEETKWVAPEGVAPGSAVDCRIVVERAFRPREFERNNTKRLVADALADWGGTKVRLVLWGADANLAGTGALRRGSRLALKNFLVKQGRDCIELHSRELCSIEHEGGDYPAPEQLSALADAEDAVASGVVLANYGAKQSGKGERAVLVFTDGTASRRLTCWDYNARIAADLAEGEVVRVEGASARKGELSAGAGAVLFRDPACLARFPRVPLNSVGEDEALVEARIAALHEARVGPSGTAFVRGSLEDASGTARFVAFGANVFRLLGARGTRLEPELLLDLKRRYLLGKKAVLACRKRTDSYGESLVAEAIASVAD